MKPFPAFQRVVLVVVDGLRASAIDELQLPVLVRMKRSAAFALDAQTVLPSVTSAAMTSLFCGVGPELHGIGAGGFAVPPAVARYRPITRLLIDDGLASSMFIGELPFGYSWLPTRMASVAGATIRTAGHGALQILAAAASALYGQVGLIAMHWPDCDRAGHKHGWHSAEYAEAARSIDVTLGVLLEMIDIVTDAGTLLVVCADHGGGGLHERDHHSTHPEDTTIPVFLRGQGVIPGPLGSGVRLVDLPATILWSLGVEIPRAYEGRPLVEAFVSPAIAA